MRLEGRMESREGNIKVISSGGNDVYVTLTDFTISNF